MARYLIVFNDFDIGTTTHTLRPMFIQNKSLPLPK